MANEADIYFPSQRLIYCCCGLPNPIVSILTSAQKSLGTLGTYPEIMKRRQDSWNYCIYILSSRWWVSDRMSIFPIGVSRHWKAASGSTQVIIVLARYPNWPFRSKYKSACRQSNLPCLMIQLLWRCVNLRKRVNSIRHNSAAEMQRSWLILSLLGPLITISAALPTLQTVNTSLDFFENDILATKGSNNTLRIDSNALPALNASNNQIVIQCFPDHSPLEMVVMDDYYGAVDQILVREDAMTPREWVLGPAHTQHIGWKEGPCRIVLMAGTTIRTPRFPIILAAHVAALVAKACVTEAHGFRGGIGTLRELGSAVVWLGAYQDGMDGPTAQM